MGIHMGRMHSFGKGQSCSMKPFKTVISTNMMKDIGQIESFILQAAKRGIQPSHIGKQLRDSYGVGNVADVLGTTMLRFLKKHHVEQTIPEDLQALMDKASQIRTHLAVHKKD